MIYTLGRTPQWASSQPNAPGPYGPGQCAPPSDLSNWDNYVNAIVTHVAGKIKYWELWNEPNDPKYYCGDIPTMVTMAQHAAQIIKSIDPTALVLSPASNSTYRTGLALHVPCRRGRGGGRRDRLPRLLEHDRRGYPNCDR